MSIEIWDPHFHVWDVAEDTRSGHDAEQLFAPNDNPLYSWIEYERDIHQAGERFSHSGGAFVEAVSVCHIEQSGSAFVEACFAESLWASEQLNQSQKHYVLVASAPLEDPGIDAILSTLAANPNVCGIRQIINFEPSWPRNGRLGNLLDNPQWTKGFGALGRHSLSFDLQLNPHQFQQASELIGKFPDTLVIIDHLGSPTLDDLQQRADQYWNGLKTLAKHERSFIKISMLSYIDESWDQNPLVRDTVLNVIEIFGIDRCFFASNFPVENNIGWDAKRLFLAFEQLVVGLYGPEDLLKLFSRNARCAYAAE